MTTTEAMAADLTLDTSGLTCPIPILKTKKALSELPSGATLEVIATDPAAPADIEAFCRATGHALLESAACASRPGTHRFLIRK